MKTCVLGSVILADKVVDEGALIVEDGAIVFAGPRSKADVEGGSVVEHDGFISPGYVDLHVHGGNGADFMDATADAFDTVVAAHARHGTTGIVPTTTVAPKQTILDFLGICRRRMQQPIGSARVLGAHFYGPYFGREAAGCHPTAPLRNPVESEYSDYLEFADVLASATVAPELPGAEGFARACNGIGVTVNVGHSHCTFDQMSEAIDWGVRHVDHLFCAMSDRARLRQTQTYPMRGGVMEATLYYDQLTTEVIADGKHLSPELLMLALKIKGAYRLALCTDCNRALDMPDGEYIFGPRDGGEPIIRTDDVGVMPDGTSLASSVMGMDHMVRTFRELTGCPLVDVIRMATLTPARIINKDHLVGSLQAGKRADFLLLDEHLNVKQVWVDGRKMEDA